MSEAVYVDILLNTYNRITKTGTVCSHDIRTLSVAVEGIDDFLALHPPESFTHVPSNVNHSVACENILRAAFDLMVRIIKAIVLFIKNTLTAIGNKLRELFDKKEKAITVAEATEKVIALARTVEYHLNQDHDKIVDQRALMTIRDELSNISQKEQEAISNTWTALDDFLLLKSPIDGVHGDDLVDGLTGTFTSVIAFIADTLSQIAKLSEDMHAVQSLNTITINDMWTLSNKQLTLEPAKGWTTLLNTLNPKWRDPNSTVIGAAVNTIDKFIWDLKSEKVSNVDYAMYLRGLNNTRYVIEQLETKVTVRDIARVKDTLELSSKTLLRGLTNLQTTNEAELIERYKTMFKRTEELSKGLDTMFKLQQSIVSSVMNTVNIAASYNKQKITLCDSAIRLLGLTDGAKAEILALRKAL